MNLYRVVYDVNDSAEEGVYGISIVDNPANKYAFIAMSEDELQKISFKAENKEKQLLTGVVLVPGQKILRQFPKTKELYELVWESDVIEKISQNFMMKGFQKMSTYNHDDSKWLNGTTVVETWLVEDPIKDKATALGFKDLPKGTWMVTMKLSDELWAEYIKTGQAKGFSIDSYVQLEKIKMDTPTPPFHDSCRCRIVNGEVVTAEDACEYCQGIADEIQQKELIKQNKQPMKKNKQNVLQSLAKFFSSIKETVEQSTIEVPELGNLSADAWELDNIVYQDVDGELMPLKDAEFEFEGNTYKTDSEGKITSKEPVATADTTATETAVNMESENVSKFEGENDITVFAEWLTLGKNLMNENHEMLPNFTFEFEGRIYSTDETGEIVKIEKNSTSPFWMVEMTETSDAATATATEDTAAIADELTKPLETVDVEALKATIEDLKSQLETIMKEKETVVMENIELAKQPTSTRLKAIIETQPNAKETKIQALARLAKK